MTTADTDLCDCGHRRQAHDPDACTALDGNHSVCACDEFDRGLTTAEVIDAHDAERLADRFADVDASGQDDGLTRAERDILTRPSGDEPDATIRETADRLAEAHHADASDWMANQEAAFDARLVAEIEAEEKAAAAALAEISYLAAKACRDLGRGDINPDVVMVGAAAEIREWLGKLDQAIGTGPAAPAGWTLATAPQGSRALAPCDGTEGEWVALGAGRWCLLPPHPHAGDGVVRHAGTLAELGGRLTLMPADAAPVGLASDVPAEPTPDAVPAEQLHGQFDAMIWARSFVALVAERPEIPGDLGTMVGWFANAIMTGYDRGQGERAATAAPMGRAPAVPVEGVGCDCTLATDPAAPESDEESSLLDVDPDSTAGRVAAELSALIGEHIGAITPWSLSRYDGQLIASVDGHTDPVLHLRAVAEILGADGRVGASLNAVGDGWLDARVAGERGGVRWRVVLCVSPRRADEQAQLRAWLAELGVEVEAQ